jgi:hypothetical protein
MAVDVFEPGRGVWLCLVAKHGVFVESEVVTRLELRVCVLSCVAGRVIKSSGRSLECFHVILHPLMNLLVGKQA